MLVLGERHVRQALDPQDCLDVNRLALTSLVVGSSVVPSRLALPYPNNPNIINDKTTDGASSSSSAAAAAAEDWTLIKPAAYYSTNRGTKHSDKSGDDDDDDDDNHTKNDVTIGLKVVSVRANNPSHGLPLVPATILLLDAKSGIVEATLAGTHLTVMRTSAGPALAVQYLQPNCKELVVFGAGAQAKCHIGLIELALKRRIPKITIINRTIQNANSLREIILEEQRMTNRHAGCYDIDGGDTVSTIDTVALNDLDGVKNALSTADVICTTTNTISPLWDGQAVSLQKGCLITSIGSYTPDMQEIPSDVVDQCHVVIDTPETLSVGDLKHLSASVDDDFITLAGDVFSNPQALLDKFKIDPQKDYMFYKAVGTAIQDVLTAKAVVENARRLGLGQDVDMS